MENTDNIINNEIKPKKVYTNAQNRAVKAFHERHRNSEEYISALDIDKLFRCHIYDILKIPHNRWYKVFEEYTTRMSTTRMLCTR
jgi:hypothetical protein